eukprot:GILK01003333.1.p1 GENE.GILK01003333.1~~GILK01003333.1.p1  ORF type:complete len:518 (+),score=95.13 GILK01003333.1:111-1664(+)
MTAPETSPRTSHVISNIFAPAPEPVSRPSTAPVFRDNIFSAGPAPQRSPRVHQNPRDHDIFGPPTAAHKAAKSPNNRDRSFYELFGHPQDDSAVASAAIAASKKHTTPQFVPNFKVLDTKTRALQQKSSSAFSSRSYPVSPTAKAAEDELVRAKPANLNAKERHDVMLSSQLFGRKTPSAAGAGTVTVDGEIQPVSSNWMQDSSLSPKGRNRKSKKLNAHQRRRSEMYTSAVFGEANPAKYETVAAPSLSDDESSRRHTERASNKNYSDLFGRATPHMDTPPDHSNDVYHITDFSDARSEILRRRATRDFGADEPVSAYDRKRHSLVSSDLFTNGAVTLRLPADGTDSNGPSVSPRKQKQIDLTPKSLRVRENTSSVMGEPTFERVEKSPSASQIDLQLKSLPPSMTTEELKRMCGGHGGQVVSINADIDPVTGRCRGSATITYRQTKGSPGYKRLERTLLEKGLKVVPTNVTESSEPFFSGMHKRLSQKEFKKPEPSGLVDSPVNNGKDLSKSSSM